MNVFGPVGPVQSALADRAERGSPVCARGEIPSALYGPFRDQSDKYRSRTRATSSSNERSFETNASDYLLGLARFLPPTLIAHPCPDSSSASSFCPRPQAPYS